MAHGRSLRRLQRERSGRIGFPKALNGDIAVRHDALKRVEGGARPHDRAMTETAALLAARLSGTGRINADLKFRTGVKPRGARHHEPALAAFACRGYNRFQRRPASGQRAATPRGCQDRVGRIGPWLYRQPYLLIPSPSWTWDKMGVGRFRRPHPRSRGRWALGRHPCERAPFEWPFLKRDGRAPRHRVCGGAAIMDLRLQRLTMGLHDTRRSTRS